MCDLICSVKIVQELYWIKVLNVIRLWWQEIEELSFIHECEWSFLGQEFSSESIWECFQETLPPESYASSCFESPRSPGSVEGPEKFPMTARSWNTSCTTPGILSFSDPGSPGRGLKKAKVARSRPVALNHEHVIAERKRREKITEKLFVLSAIVPGLKKVSWQLLTCWSWQVFVVKYEKLFIGLIMYSQLRVIKRKIY